MKLWDWGKEKAGVFFSLNKPSPGFVKFVCVDGENAAGDGPNLGLVPLLADPQCNIQQAFLPDIFSALAVEEKCAPIADCNFAFGNCFPNLQACQDAPWNPVPGWDADGATDPVVGTPVPVPPPAVVESSSSSSCKPVGCEIKNRWIYSWDEAAKKYVQVGLQTTVEGPGCPDLVVPDCEGGTYYARSWEKDAPWSGSDGADGDCGGSGAGFGLCAQIRCEAPMVLDNVQSGSKVVDKRRAECVGECAPCYKSEVEYDENKQPVKILSIYCRSDCPPTSSTSSGGSGGGGGGGSGGGGGGGSSASSNYWCVVVQSDASSASSNYVPNCDAKNSLGADLYPEVTPNEPCDSAWFDCLYVSDTHSNGCPFNFRCGCLRDGVCERCADCDALDESYQRIWPYQNPAPLGSGECPYAPTNEGLENCDFVTERYPNTCPKVYQCGWRAIDGGSCHPHDYWEQAFVCGSFSNGQYLYPVTTPECDGTSDCTYVSEYYGNGCPKVMSCGCLSGGSCVPCASFRAQGSSARLGVLSSPKLGSLDVGYAYVCMSNSELASYSGWHSVEYGPYSASECASGCGPSGGGAVSGSSSSAVVGGDGGGVVASSSSSFEFVGSSSSAGGGGGDGGGGSGDGDGGGVVGSSSSAGGVGGDGGGVVSSSSSSTLDLDGSSSSSVSVGGDGGGGGVVASSSSSFEFVGSSSSAGGGEGDGGGGGGVYVCVTLARGSSSSSDLFDDFGPMCVPTGEFSYSVYDFVSGPYFGLSACELVCGVFSSSSSSGLEGSSSVTSGDGGSVFDFSSSSSVVEASSSTQGSSSVTSGDCSSGYVVSMLTVLDANPELEGYCYAEDAENGWIGATFEPVEFRYEALGSDGLPISVNVWVGSEAVGTIVIPPGYAGRGFAVVFRGVVYCGVLDEAGVVL